MFILFIKTFIKNTSSQLLGVLFLFGSIIYLANRNDWAHQLLNAGVMIIFLFAANCFFETVVISFNKIKKEHEVEVNRDLYRFCVTAEHTTLYMLLAAVTAFIIVVLFFPPPVPPFK